MASTRRPKYVKVDGFWLSNTFIPEYFRSAFDYQPRPDDIFVATYPKCGNTWMCQIVLLLVRNGKVISSQMEYLMSCPFLEFSGSRSLVMMNRPGCIKTHLPFDSLKFSKEAKYIYVARHPRDCVVSFYHHTRFFPNYYFSDGTFDEFFELFIRGETDFNDYFDNLFSWYEHRDEPNVFFTTFEDMKADHRGTVVKVAEFLGLDLSDQLLEKVVAHSSFDYMKTETNKLFLGMERATEVYPVKHPLLERVEECFKAALADGHKPVGQFIRNGRVGEGKTVLSEDQEERLQARIEEKTRGSDVMSLWK